MEHKLFTSRLQKFLLMYSCFNPSMTVQMRSCNPMGVNHACGTEYWKREPEPCEFLFPGNQLASQFTGPLEKKKI